MTAAGKPRGGPSPGCMVLAVGAWLLGLVMLAAALAGLFMWQPWLTLDRESDCQDWDRVASWSKPTLDEKIGFLQDLGMSVDRAEGLVPLVDRFCGQEKNFDANVAEIAETLDLVERRLR